MFAKAPVGLVAAGVVVSPTADPEPFVADDVAGAAVVLVVAELPVELVAGAVVLVEVEEEEPEPGVIRKGAENTLGAVKSF